MLIAGHGRFASGILSGIEMIFGPQQGVRTVEFVDGETKTELDAKMDASLRDLESDDGVLLFCDVLQGSPFQSAADHALRDDRIRVIFGANTAMILEATAALMNGTNDIDALARSVVEVGKNHMGIFDPKCKQEDDDWE